MSLMPSEKDCLRSRADHAEAEVKSLRLQLRIACQINLTLEEVSEVVKAAKYDERQLSRNEACDQILDAIQRKVATKEALALAKAQKNTRKEERT